MADFFGLFLSRYVVLDGVRVLITLHKAAQEFEGIDVGFDQDLARASKAVCPKERRNYSANSTGSYDCF